MYLTTTPVNKVLFAVLALVYGVTTIVLIFKE